MEQALHFARQTDQRVPCAVHREIVAARINHRDFAPELGHGAQHFELAREKLLVHHGKLDVFLDGLRAADADAEIVDVAAQDSPGIQPRSSRSERQCRCRFAAVVAGRGVARKRKRLGRRSRQAPDVLPFPDLNPSGSFRRPPGRFRVPQLHAELIGEIFFRFAGRFFRHAFESRSSAAMVHLFGKPAPHVAPIAQVFGEAPQQLERPFAERGDFAGGGFEKFLSGRRAILRAGPPGTGRLRSNRAGFWRAPIRPAARGAALR